MDRPAFYRLPVDIWDALLTLPSSQRGKALNAICSYFFDGTLPEALPGRADTFFQTIRPALESYRRSVLNGSKNRPFSRQKQKKTDEKCHAVSATDSDTSFEGSTGALPAEKP